MPLAILTAPFVPEPWDEPQIDEKVSVNKSCFEMNWKQPTTPNGEITKYEVNFVNFLTNI